MVSIPRLRAVIERWQERFLTRVFTAREIDYCRARRDPVPHFAARFAAKEAGLKALGTGPRLRGSWRARGGEGGGPQGARHRPAARRELARAGGAARAGPGADPRALRPLAADRSGARRRPPAAPP